MIRRLAAVLVLAVLGVSFTAPAAEARHDTGWDIPRPCTIC